MMLPVAQLCTRTETNCLGDQFRYTPCAKSGLEVLVAKLASHTLLITFPGAQTRHSPDPTIGTEPVSTQLL